MPAPTTDEDLLELVRKSALVSPERLEAFLRNNGPLPGRPRRLARRMIRQGLLTVFQATQLLQGRYRGFYLSKYLILERLGRGGAGTVYLCEHPAMRRRVAIKVLSQVQTDSSSVERFYREARAIAALDHPNLVRAYDIDEAKGLHFLVLEFVHGPNLQNLVERKGPLDVVRAAEYIRQAALGLQHLHEAGLVHRDVKPSNLLVDAQGNVKILDMGLTRFFDDEEGLSKKYEENVLGTADYLSPEQAVNSHDVDIRTDIYSLGATFYFLLAGRPPFPGGSLQQKLLSHHLEVPQPIQEIRPDVPDGLAAILERMLAKDRAQRYAEPAAVAAELVPWIQESVPPPAAEELPPLCPAAGGPPVPLPSSEARPGSVLPPTDPGNPASASSAGLSSSAGAGELANPPKPQLIPASVSAITAIAALPKQDHREAIQEHPSSDTDPAIAPANTLSALPELPDSSAVTLALPLWRRGWFQTVLAASLLLLAIGIGWGIRWALTRQSSTPIPEAPPEQLPISPPPAVRLIPAKAGQARDFSTLAEALTHVKTGDRLLVLADTLDAPLSLKGDAGLPPGVILEGRARDGQAVRWLPPLDYPPEQPLLTLQGLAGWTLRGFEFDGEHRLDDLVVLSGHCPGLTLENVQLEGFCRCGVWIHNCQGDDEQPVSLLRTRFAHSCEDAAAIRLCVQGDAINRQVQILESRFEGPSRSAVDVLGGVKGLLIKGNRFYQTTSGIFYRKQRADQPFQGTLEANTFCAVQKALHFGDLPAGKQTRLEVTNNLFYATKKLAQIDGFRRQPAQVKAHWIWFDEGNPLESAPVQDRFFRKTIELPAALTGRAYLDIACDYRFTVWLNGERIGQGDLGTPVRRVHSYDITTHLRTGKNVLAVQAKNRTKDGRAGPAGLLAQLSWKGAEGPTTIVTDRSWLTSKSGPRGWNQPPFDDSKWKPARQLTDYGKGPAEWKGLIWDAMLREQLHDATWPVLITARGNVRNQANAEGFPPLFSRLMTFTLPTDPTKDVQFLRYSLTSPLYEAGYSKAPVGAPPAP